jgi:predicted DNA-binding transcriptional regulator AlpA
MRAPASSDKLIGSRTLRERYDNISDMTVWRWLHDPYLGFPQPIYLGKRRYWRLGDLEAWERSRAAASQGEAA